MIKLEVNKMLKQSKDELIEMIATIYQDPFIMIVTHPNMIFCNLTNNNDSIKDNLRIISINSQILMCRLRSVYKNKNNLKTK